MPKILRHILLALAIGWTGLWNGLACADNFAFNSAAQHYQQGDWKEAASLFSDCLSDKKHSEQHGTAARFYLAECQMQLGDYAAAREVYLKVLSTGEDSFKARALFRAGELKAKLSAQAKPFHNPVRRIGWHVPHTLRDEDAQEVIYIDHNHLHMVGNVDTGASSQF